LEIVKGRRHPSYSTSACRYASAESIYSRQRNDGGTNDLRVMFPRHDFRKPSEVTGLQAQREHIERDGAVVGRLRSVDGDPAGIVDPVVRQWRAKICHRGE
jgi:hypothetical protein